MIDVTLFVGTLFCTVSVMLTIACIVCLVEFRNNDRVKDVWWNPLILNISTAFTPSIRLITCVPLGVVQWILSNRWKAVFIGAVYLMYEWTGGATGTYIRNLDVIYRDGFQLTVRTLLEQIMRTYGIIWDTFVMLYNWVVIAGFAWVASLWDILGSCGSDVSVWLKILTSPFRAMGSFFGAFHTFFFNKDQTLYSSWLVQPFNIRPALGELQNGLIVFSKELDCLCQGLKPAISASVNCFADSNLAETVNSVLNIFVSMSQSVFRMVSNDFSNLDVGPVFYWWDKFCFSLGTWIDRCMTFLLNGLSGEFGQTFVIPEPFVFASIGRIFSAIGGFSKIPLMMLIAVIENPDSSSVVYEASNMHEPFAQLDIAVSGLSQSAQWTYEMSQDIVVDAASVVLPVDGAPWPSNTGPLQCEYWSLNYYKETQDVPQECHCSKATNCGSGATCNAMTGNCDCHAGFVPLYPPKPGPYPCVARCKSSSDCVGQSGGLGTCQDGYCHCAQVSYYNIMTGKCESSSEFPQLPTTDDDEKRGPPLESMKPETCAGTEVENIGPAFGCAVQSLMRATVGVIYVSMNFAREFLFNLEQDIVHANFDGLSHMYALLENADGHWYPRSASVTCEYRKQYTDDCTVFTDNCNCEFNASDPGVGTYSPYCMHPTLNANVYSHLDALGFYSGMAFWPRLFSNNVGVMLTSVIRFFVETARVVTRVISGTGAFVHDLIATIIDRVEDEGALAAVNIIADLENNLANLPTNCRWGIPFEGPIFPVARYDPSMDIKTLKHEITKSRDTLTGKRGDFCSEDVPTAACNKYDGFMKWSANVASPRSSYHALKAVRQLNEYHLMNAIQNVAAQCKHTNTWCNDRRSGFSTTMCGTTNNDRTCYCNPSLPYNSNDKCTCMPYISTLEYTITGVNQGSYHDEMFARLFSKEDIPRCNAMVLEWTFYRAGEFFVGLEQTIDLLENSDPVALGSTGKCYNPDKEYQIVHKSSLDSMYQPMTPVYYGQNKPKSRKMIGVRDHKSFAPCGIIGACGNCWCEVWVSNEFVCDVGMAVRQFSWTILNIAHEITTVGIGIVTVGAGATDLNVPARLCDAQRTVAPAAAGFSALIGMTSHLITKDTEQRIASTLFTILDMYFFVPVAFMDSIVISVKELIESPLDSVFDFGPFITNMLTTLVRTDFVLWCQFLLGIDRAVNGIQQDGTIRGSQTSGGENVIGPLLSVSQSFISIIDELMEDVGLLIIKVTLGFVNILVDASDEAVAQFFSNLVKMIEKIATLVAKDAAKFLKALISLLPEPFATLVQGMVTLDCTILYTFMSVTKSIIDAMISAINGATFGLAHVHKPNFGHPEQNLKKCMSAFSRDIPERGAGPLPNQPGPSPHGLFPPTPVGWDSPKRRRLSEENQYIGAYNTLRDNWDWNGTSMCSLLGSMPNAPSTPEGRILYSDCVRRRWWSMYLNAMLNRTYIPSSMFDDWNTPIEYGILLLRSFIPIIANDKVDQRALEQQGYPVEAARDLHNFAFKFGLDTLQNLRPTELRKTWIPTAFPDYKTNEEGIGYTLDRIFSRIEKAPPLSISGQEIGKAANAVGATVKRIRGQIWPDTQPIAIAAPTPAPVRGVVRRRLVETTGAGMPLPSESVGVSDIPCPTHGICTNCAVLDSFLGRIMDVTYNVGDYYSTVYVDACNRYSRFMAQPDNVPANYPRIANATNNVHPSAEIEQPAPKKSLGSAGGGFFEMFHRSTDFKDAVSRFFMDFTCGRVPVFDKSLWCYLSQPFKTCSYEDIAVNSCKSPLYSIGDSLTIVAYTWLGIELFGLITTLYIPAVVRYPVFFGAYLMARYDYSFSCFPVMPYCLFRDFEWVMEELFPKCFCNTFRANLASGEICNSTQCSSFDAGAPHYQDCPAQELGPLWAPLFFIRWQAPSLFTFMFNSGWSPFHAFRSSNADIVSMLEQVSQHVSVTRYEVNCFYIQLPTAMAVFFLVPMAFSLIIALIFAILPLIRVAIVQAILSGYFVLDEVPKMSLEREKERDGSAVDISAEAAVSSLVKKIQ